MGLRSYISHSDISSGGCGDPSILFSRRPNPGEAQTYGRVQENTFAE